MCTYSSGRALPPVARICIIAIDISCCCVVAIVMLVLGDSIKSPFAAEVEVAVAAIAACLLFPPVLGASRWRYAASEAEKALAAWPSSSTCSSRRAFRQARSPGVHRPGRPRGCKVVKRRIMA